MLLPFQLATGTIVGRSHVGQMSNLLVGKPNQDAIGFRRTPHCIVGTVHDGCGSGEFSEVGARIGARIVVDCIAKAVKNGTLSAGLKPNEQTIAWEKVRRTILGRMYVEASRFTEDPGCTPSHAELTETIRNYFLFTTVGILITASETTVFSIGDGYWALNGQLTQIPKFEGNAPPYLAYELVNSKFDAHKDQLQFQIRAVVPTADVQSVFVACDGLEEFIAHENSNIPGKAKKVGPVSQLWEDGSFFTGQFYEEETGQLIQGYTRLFRSINSESCKLTPEKTLRRELGLIQDDLTALALRREPQLVATPAPAGELEREAQPPLEQATEASQS